jgi:hypothetical protein
MSFTPRDLVRTWRPQGPTSPVASSR